MLPSGKTALVTGASRGAGAALALLWVAGVPNFLDLPAACPYYANCVVGLLLLAAVLLDRLRGGDAYE